jgi:hypothetical protein
MMDESKNKEIERLEAELRQLPKPSVPADLEARLLAAIPKNTKRPHRFRYAKIAAAASLAAGLLIALSFFFFDAERKPGPRQSVADMNLQIQRESIAARLNAATQILASQPGGKKIAEETYRYLAANYPDTEIGKQLIQWRKQ